MQIDTLCINTIRTLSIDAVEKAKSGHPGLPLGAAPMAYILWQRHLRHSPDDPQWPNRDRFILSAGHGSMLLYSLLYLYGYDLSLDDIKSFRQWGSKTPGHPESFVTPGVEATTGPLGQGVANAVGMAIAERMLAQRLNRPDHQLIDHRTFALVSDGDLMEGIAYEAAAIAGHLHLGKLVLLYDANDVSLDGPLELAASEDVGKRHEAMGWHVQTVEDGDTDLEAIDRALEKACAETARPSIVIVRTTLGYGSPNKSGKAAAHGAPLGADEVALTKKALEWQQDEPFFVPDEARAHFASRARSGNDAQQAWKRSFESWCSAQPALATSWQRATNGDGEHNWQPQLPTFAPGSTLPTRQASGETLNQIAKVDSWLVGGDADIGSSTKARIKESPAFDGTNGGRNIHFGVREHAMAAIANGMAYHGGGLRPFVSTFFQFVDYMRPAVRLAAMSSLPVLYVFTHDSIAVGEDGPTHHPIEHLMALRLIPELQVVRPADANETVAAWRVAMTDRSRPTALVLTRQGVPTLAQTEKLALEGVARGAYVMSDCNGDPQALILATGSEVSLALEAQERLTADGVRTRVVSMPCWERFAAQPTSYREEVLPPAVTSRVAVEAGVSLGWQRWVGERGAVVGIDTFTSSAPGPVLSEKLGMTAERVTEAVRGVL